MITQTTRDAVVLPLPQVPTLGTYFGREHVLADVAARHCKAHRSPYSTTVACGPCWEMAIRDDERFAVEFGLPRELNPDPEYIDEIAVDLACRGERVELTGAEFTVAVDRLRAQSLAPTTIAKRLHASYHAVVCTVRRESAGLAA